MSTISAVIPAYNRADTLGRALRSVFAQTRLPEEVVVVDDASTDDTARVAAQFAGVRVLKLERNSGAATARNEGIRHSRGELIAFLDADDEWLPPKLETQLAILDGPGTPDLVCTGIVVHASGGGIERHGFDGLAPEGGWSFREFQNYPFCPTTWLIRRAVFEASGPFDAAMPNCEDLDFLARITGRHRIQVTAALLAVKYNRRDSLDVNLERTRASYDTLFARYPELWAQAPESVVSTLVRLASMQVEAGEVVAARASLWRAVRRYPAFPSPWLLLFASLFGSQNYWRAWRRVA